MENLEGASGIGGHPSRGGGRGEGAEMRLCGGGESGRMDGQILEAGVVRLAATVFKTVVSRNAGQVGSTPMRLRQLKESRTTE